MGKVRILPDEIVSRIAAGEIVERPASVVKELIENSIDAGCSSLGVEVRSGGKRLIRVTDDGEGMTRDEALLALERHATSKIRSAQDLLGIGTLGFRGEALPSIAAVSRFEMVTKPRDAVVGTRISVYGGKLRKVSETGSAAGTTVEVKGLFFNTPARLKFLRTRETELAQVIDTLQREALSNPGVGFELLSDGRVVLRLPKRSKIEQRLPEIWKGARLYPIEAEGEGISVSGFLSDPEEARTTTQRLYFSVNGRAVRDRFLTRLVLDSYGRLIERGRFPQGLINIELPTDGVDVNVHPAKTEVRFRNRRLVGDLLRSAVGGMVERAPWIEGYGSRARQAGGDLIRGGSPEGTGRGGSDRDYATYYGLLKEQANEIPLAAHEGGEPSYEHSPHAPYALPAHPPVPSPEQGPFASMRILGQIGGLYIICESPKGALIVDQHAAHERINYERIQSSYRGRDWEIQELLIPQIIDFSPAEAQTLREHIDEIGSLGISLEEFGGNSFRLRALPALLGGAEPEGLLRDIAHEIGEAGSQWSMSEHLDRILSTMACHCSIRAGDELSEDKMRALLRELDRARFPHACPHGRPVAREITWGELERLFKRT